MKISSAALGIFLLSPLLVSCATPETGSPNLIDSVSPSSATSPAVTSSAVAIVKADKGNDFACDRIIPGKDLYELSPNFGLIPDTNPGLTPETKLASSLGAVTCVVTNLTTKAQIEITAIKLTSQSAKHVTAKISADPTSTKQEFQATNVGYFTSQAGIGQLQFVRNDYWVVLAATNWSQSIQSAGFATLVSRNLPN